MHFLKVLPLALPLVVACADPDVEVIENIAPTAIALGAGTYARGVVVIFDGSTSTDADGTVTTFSWAFGDAATGTGALAEHIYNAAGAFDVTLTVTDDKGATNAVTIQVVIDANEAPVAVIDAPLTGGVGQSLRFDGASSTDADGTVTSFSWDFGDGTTATGPLIDKAFETDGPFTVTLTVTDDNGAEGQAQHSLNIEEAPAGFNGDWSWFLTDESLRDLGFLCGEFQDSQLTILTNVGDITITEHAGGTDVPYSGSLTGSDFTVANDQLGVVQTISGTFTSATTFTGTYTIETGLSECAVRPVEGTRNP